MARQTNRRPAFTLVEMITVIAIVAILFALMISAVQPIREASNRAYCRNNLRQMGLAFLAHHDAHGVFPSGGTYWYDTPRRFKPNTNNTVPEVWDKQSWGWGYQILPYIDQKNIWQDVDDKNVGDHPMAMYHCPSARPFVRFHYGQAGADCYRYMWEYSGNGGTWGDWPNLTISGNSLDGPIVPAKSFSNRFVSKETILDGISNVMLIGEKYLDKNALELQPICSDDQGWVDGWDNDAIAFCRGTSASNPPVLPKRFDNQVGCGFFFGSAHTQMQCVFCDGSVHVVHYDIAPNVWQALLSINDGTPINSIGFD